MIVKLSTEERDVITHYFHHMIMLSIQNKDKVTKKYLTRVLGKIDNTHGYCNLKIKDIGVCVNVLNLSNSMIETDALPKIRESDKPNKEEIIKRLEFFLQYGKQALLTIQNLDVLQAEAQ